MKDLENLFDEELELEKDDDIIDIDKSIDDEHQDTFFEDSTESQKTTSGDPLINDLLKAKGFNEGKIKIINEDNEEQEVDFYLLSKQEQLDILNSTEEVVSDDLEESEVSLLNYIRTNKLTVDEFLEGYKEAVLKEAGISNSPVYEIDSYDDNELFLLDLQQKYDLTEEELQQELEKELQNSDLFKRKIDKIRAEYKQLEDEYKDSQIEAENNQRQEQYSNLVNTISSIASNTPIIYGLELEDSEKQEVLSFLLELDKDGVSSFYKALNDPKKLYEAAWFLRYGKESFETIQTAYEAEIAKLKQVKSPIVDKPRQQNKPQSLFDLD